MNNRILIIEDDEAITEALKALLEARGFQVDIATDGDEGTDRCAQTNPDLVILDLFLPGTDGVEVYQRIKQGPRGGSTPIIVLSSLTKKQMVREVNSAAEVIDEELMYSKPVDPDALISKIQELIQDLRCGTP